jgi:PEP-CTERM motif
MLGFGAQAATVRCPGSLGGDLTRQVEVSGALAGGECYYQAGNFQGDAFPALGSYTLIDKDVAPNEQAEGGLLYTANGARDAGTWTMAQNYWLTYAELFLAMHFGNGSGNPDSFIVELDPGALTGTWALLPSELANGLSNIYLIGRGSVTSTSSTSSSGGTSTSGNTPEPGSTLTLLGLGLLGLGYTRRRRGLVR